MNKVSIEMSKSLDGYVAGPDDGWSNRRWTASCSVGAAQRFSDGGIRIP
jgi:hypothetical protein